MGEEYGRKEGNSDLTWVIDPIDGTKSFITGIPLWGTLIGLEVNGIPELGIIDLPSTKERYLGSNSFKRAIRVTGGKIENVVTSDEKNLINLKVS